MEFKKIDLGNGNIMTLRHLPEMDDCHLTYTTDSTTPLFLYEGKFRTIKEIEEIEEREIQSS